MLAPAKWRPGRRRLWLFWLLSLFVAWFGYRMAIDTVSLRLSRSQPELALWLKPDQSTALVALAEQHLLTASAPEERAAVRELAVQALVENPLEARAIRALGLVAAAEGDTVGALVLMSASAARSRRDRQTEWWLVQNAGSENNDVSAMLEHIDNLLTVTPKLAVPIQPLLTTMLIAPEPRHALAKRLANFPRWRGEFLRNLDPTAGEGVAAGASALFEQLKASGAPVKPGELFSYLFRLIRSGAEEKAYQDWVSFLVPDDRLEGLGNVYNGDFSFPFTKSPFDWTLREGSGFASSIRELGAGEPARYALTVDFAGGRTPFEGVFQYMTLPPGNYRLSGYVVSELATKRGMQWVVICNRQRRVAGQTDLIRGTSHWHTFQTDFAIGDDCPSQMLSLRLAARIPAEEEISGRVSFTKIEINRMPAPISVIPDAYGAPSAK